MQCLPRVSKPEYSGARLSGNAWQRRNIPAPAREGLNCPEYLVAVESRDEPSLSFLNPQA